MTLKKFCARLEKKMMQTNPKQIAYEKFFSVKNSVPVKVNYSVGICGTTTAGYGELDCYGYFEYPLSLTPDLRVAYTLFIDDEREPPQNAALHKTLVVRSSLDAIHAVMTYGVPSFISYDHDLGGDDTSTRFINWLIEAYLSGVIRVFPTDYYVHSQNPVGKQNIEGLLQAFIKTQFQNKDVYAESTR